MHQRQRAHVEPPPILSLSTATEQASYELTDGVGLHVRFECQVGVLKVVEGGDRGPQRRPGPLFKSCDVEGHSAGDHPQVAPRLPPSGLAGRHERVARTWPQWLRQVDRRGDSGAGDDQHLAQRLSILATRPGQGLSPLGVQGEQSGGATSRGTSTPHRMAYPRTLRPRSLRGGPMRNQTAPRVISVTLVADRHAATASRRPRCVHPCP